MATATVVFLAITLALGSACASANFTFPFISSFGDEACKTNICGKGSCVPWNNSVFGFECQCQQGWKQSRPENDQFFKFLPCVVPNCNVSFNCDMPPAPAPAPNLKNANQSVFDPCSWTDCGGGSCNNTSMFTHSCTCEEAYYNLFNSSSFPCYKECAMRGDCPNLGIAMGNLSNPTPSGPGSSSVVGDNSSHAASSLIAFSWLITIVATLAPFLWNYT
ncbi:hypothetical protein SASPL_100460 [Salvia splendens]|uniref:EGF-like domain-containing protein n=1 Tax=Salvia splendens TaxID=180675 RepID=A0A8X8YSQ9_SALSN|nr:slit homolog 2 protein-like isoform X1 [Salvia splendens]KAG6435586.1 hypothetical protein SASPL_100460 [Salvia splendens]